MTSVDELRKQLEQAERQEREERENAIREEREAKKRAMVAERVQYNLEHLKPILAGLKKAGIPSQNMEVSEYGKIHCPYKFDVQMDWMYGISEHSSKPRIQVYLSGIGRGERSTIHYPPHADGTFSTEKIVARVVEHYHTRIQREKQEKRRDEIGKTSYALRDRIEKSGRLNALRFYTTISYSYPDRLVISLPKGFSLTEEQIYELDELLTRFNTENS